MLDTDPELAASMTTTLRKLIEVLGVESKLGKTRLAEITRCLRLERKPRLRTVGQTSVTSSLLACGKQR
jgi:hypothetical protein